MNLFYKIASHDPGSGEIIIPKPLFSQAGFIYPTFITLHSGMKKLRALARVSRACPVYTLFISGDILEKLLLPKDISYQLIIEGTDIHLGPVIGLLFGKEESRLTGWRLKKALEHTSIYPHMNKKRGQFSIILS
jgi:hypothetical protein